MACLFRISRTATRGWLHPALFACLGVLLTSRPAPASGASPIDTNGLPASIQTVLKHTLPLPTPRGSRLPLFVLPISHALAGIPDDRTETALRQLAERGIAYSVAWNPEPSSRTAEESLRIARLQPKLGMPVAADATACLMSFFDGTDATLHVDDNGHPFAETSFGGKLGCPFTLEPRIPVIRARIEVFLRAHREAGLPVDFVFADWEIDGPIEWNDAWASSKKCRRCREQLPGLGDFRQFQQRLRAMRSELQRAAFAEPVRKAFPQAWVGNYGVNPHNGHRYWYDYFEKDAPDGLPYVTDQRARYREWAHEFAGTDYSCALPVIYTWYPMFGWFDFEPTDFRWFRPMLLEGSSAGRHTKASTPLIPFVHWHTTAPPEKPDPATVQFSAAHYQDLLAHLLLRGHDTFFLWCMPEELATEVRLVHEVYADSLKYGDFLTRGTPGFFDVPERPGPVVSALRLGDRVLARRTDFPTHRADINLLLPGGAYVTVPSRAGWLELEARPRARDAGFLEGNGRNRFPIGFYDLPATEGELAELAAAGVNLIRCNNRADLDRAAAAGLRGWVPLPLDAGPTDALAARIGAVKDHPALELWEGPDEVVWNFTAYSGLERSAGFTRADWQRQTPRAVHHAERERARILGNLRQAIELLRRLDGTERPVWINEAADSDAAYVRQYLGDVQITGCDYYPVRSTGTDLPTVGRLVDRWRGVGEDRPVWMVLQAFSWHAIKPERTRLYPTLDQSRFMAFDAIVHGARGILYWGASTADDAGFRKDLLRVTREISTLGPYLTGPDVPGIRTRILEDAQEAPPIRGIRTALRRHGNDFLLLLVNEDPTPRPAVEVLGLDTLSGRRLVRNDGAEAIAVANGACLTRLQGLEVKAFLTTGQ